MWSPSFLQKRYRLHSGLYFQIQFLQLSLSGLICRASRLCSSSPDLQAWLFPSCFSSSSTPQHSKKQLSALSYAQSFCNDDSERDSTPFLKPQDAVDMFELVIHNTHVPHCLLVLLLHLVTWLLLPREPPPHTPLLYTSPCWCLIVFAGHQDSHQALLTSKMLGHISSPSHALTSYSIKERSWTDLPHPSPLCCSQTALELFWGSGLRFSDPSFSASHWRSGVGFALPSHHIPQGTLPAITRGSELDKTSTLE